MGLVDDDGLAGLNDLPIQDHVEGQQSVVDHAIPKPLSH